MLRADTRSNCSRKLAATSNMAAMLPYHGNRLTASRYACLWSTPSSCVTGTANGSQSSSSSPNMNLMPRINSCDRQCDVLHGSSCDGPESSTWAEPQARWPSLECFIFHSSGTHSGELSDHTGLFTFHKYKKASWCVPLKNTEAQKCVYIYI